ncbi:superoxide dismutase family protein [Streptomyces halobius]|uniref:Superoxide dismutase family protein n=1 Tax=Streptomyces halobius TaxID=2879846 RepID=A0ABY4MGB8_9ACTN|nr:superoxide dismutase family protein [Streptomyces halobius]UQA95759.1 superoxide dismutase family protein [Streptomyces halobius]
MVAGRRVRAVGLAAGVFAAASMTLTTAMTTTEARAEPRPLVPPKAAPAAGPASPAGATVLPAPAVPVPDKSFVRPVWLQAHGWFAPPKKFKRSRAVTYDLKRVPAGARVKVGEFARRHSTLIALKVWGLQPGRTYGAHVHTKPCGAKPDDSGPHYQHRKDPHQPSTDPTYANPKNEVWLDFTTDRKGYGAALARNDWRLRPAGARSVVIHEHRTARTPGKAGTAGDRLGCFTVPFERSGLHGPFSRR